MGVRLGGWFRGPRAMFAIAPLMVPLILTSVSTAPQREAATSNDPIAAAVAIDPIDFTTIDQQAPEPLPEHSIVLPIEPGDTMQAVLQRGGLEPAAAFQVASGFAETVDPRRLRPGDPITFRYDADDKLSAVVMKVTGWGHLEANRQADATFAVRPVQAEESSQEVVVHGTIESSLGEAVMAAGESQGLVNDLVDIFQWDIDFFRLQRGDAFTAVVRKNFVGEDFVGYGPVQAARFEHNGNVYEAFRHESAGVAGYYGRTGSPLRKQFLRSPLKYSRITSGFNLRRFHPILKTVRPHYGVDYGAPTGTPVMTTADGVVVSAKYDKGEGNFVRIRHNSRVESYYLHLSKFAAGIKAGVRVEQGDVIGYVGSTGLSTAPHLDYRVRDGGKWINPSGLKSVTADPLGGRELASFRAKVARLTSKIDPSVMIAEGSNRGQTIAR